MAPPLNLNRLAHFVAVVDTGSFTAAAERLGVTKAVVSQHVARLEQEVKTTLLVRTTRRLVPTEAGIAFHRTCSALLRQAEEAVAELSDGSGALHGTIRVTAPFDYGTSVLAPAAVRLNREHPECRVDLILTDQSLDLLEQRLDMAIRIGWLADSSNQARRIGDFRQILVGSPELAARLDLRSPADLAAVPWIAHSMLPRPCRWSFSPADGGAPVEVETRAVLSANATQAVRACLLQGAGLSVLPDYAAGSDIAAGRLVALLPQWHLPAGGIHAVFPPARFRSGIARTLLGFLKDADAAIPR